MARNLRNIPRLAAAFTCLFVLASAWPQAARAVEAQDDNWTRQIIRILKKRREGQALSAQESKWYQKYRANRQRQAEGGRTDAASAKPPRPAAPTPVARTKAAGPAAKPARAGAPSVRIRSEEIARLNVVDQSYVRRAADRFVRRDDAAAMQLLATVSARSPDPLAVSLANFKRAEYYEKAGRAERAKARPLLLSVTEAPYLFYAFDKLVRPLVKRKKLSAATAAFKTLLANAKRPTTKVTLIRSMLSLLRREAGTEAEDALLREVPGLITYPEAVAAAKQEAEARERFLEIARAAASASASRKTTVASRPNASRTNKTRKPAPRKLSAKNTTPAAPVTTRTPVKPPLVIAAKADKPPPQTAAQVDHKKARASAVRSLLKELRSLEEHGFFDRADRLRKRLEAYGIKPEEHEEYNKEPADTPVF